MQLKFGATIVACLTLTACSVSTPQPETWQNFSDQKVTTENLSKGESLVVFYREPNTQGVAIDIFVNKDYQTSLLNGGFSAVKLCANQNFISTSYTSNSNFGNRTSGVNFYTPSQQITYIKVTGSINGNPNFEFVPTEIGQAEVDNLQYQANVLSRVVTQHCDNNNYVIANYNVPFAFDKSSSSSLPQEVQVALAEFIQQLQQPNYQITQVKVAGYADPVGTDNYNLNLSAKRANTVANIISQNNSSLLIQSSGLGKNNLLHKDCTKQFAGNRSLINQCNAANRRVEITAFGQN